MKAVFVLVFSLLISVTVSAQKQFSVYFDSDQKALNQKEQERLDLWILVNPEIKVVGIYGFCDEDGSIVYNDTLAKNRIETVYSILKTKVKIRDDFKSRSFGKLHQLSKIKAENRKVSLYYLEAADLAQENEILGLTEEKTKTERPAVKFPEKLEFDNPNGTKSAYKLDVAFMKKMNEARVGEKLKLSDFNFVINTYIVVAESKAKLYELLVVLQNNPNLKIEIQGHLCCMANDRLDLSTQRAKAIKLFLVANGIDSKRLSFKGFGSTQPIFPLPEKDEMQRAANRRVEIMIVENQP